ncbi:MAG: hypothetical protein JNK72_19995 [Myxococcales bacterium]|nr:hypothetical protein [Myxococcales bacterium]
MSEPLRPWKMAFRGVVEAQAVLIDRALGEPEARARVLRLWHVGAALWALSVPGREGLYVVSFASPRRLRAETAPGAPVLALRGGGFTVRSAAPLAPDEVAWLGRRNTLTHQSLVLMRGGEAALYTLAPGDQHDPSAWIALDDLTVCAVEALGDPPPKVLAEVEPVDAKRLRPKGGDALAKALDAAVRAAAKQDPALAHWVTPQTDLRRPPRGLADRLKRWVSRALAPTPDSASRQHVDSVNIALPPGPELASLPAEAGADGAGWWSRVRRWLRDRLGPTLESAQRGSGALLGARQARAMEAMIEMFRRGDLDAGLRHAIPLGGPSGQRESPLPVTWDAPAPRGSLSIGLRAAEGVIGTGGPGLEGLLTRLYRDAATRLEAEGRVAEAAFVLAELMRLPGEAVALYERHKDYGAAARLADLARLDAALRATLWWRHGDHARAIEIAREEGVFAALAVQAADGAHGPHFRAAWIEHLASTGDLFNALRLARETPEGFTERLPQWRDALLKRGGATGALVLAQSLGEGVALDGAMAEALGALLTPDRDNLTVRQHFARGVDATRVSPSQRQALRALARAQARDAAVSGSPADRDQMFALLGLAQDGLLAADLPTWPTFAKMPLESRPQSVAWSVEASDVGETPVWDVALLPNGALLLALGEAGLSLRRGDGTERLRVSVVCHALVRHAQGASALALGERGENSLISRVNLDTGAVTSLGEATFDTVSNWYDGDVWVVAQEGEVLCLDALDTRLRVMRGPGQMPRIPGHRVERLAVSATRVAALRRGAEWVQTEWSLPSWSRVETKPMPRAVLGLSAGGGVLWRATGATLWVEAGPTIPGVELTHAPGAEVTCLDWQPPWLVYAVRVEGAVVIEVYSEASRRVVARIRWHGAHRVRAAVFERTLCVVDLRGRVERYDLRDAGAPQGFRV